MWNWDLQCFRLRFLGPLGVIDLYSFSFHDGVADNECNRSLGRMEFTQLMFAIFLSV